MGRKGRDKKRERTALVSLGFNRVGWREERDKGGKRQSARKRGVEGSK